MKKYYLNDDETLNFSSREDFQSYIDYRKETDEWKLHFINTLACYGVNKLPLFTPSDGLGISTLPNISNICVSITDTDLFLMTTDGIHYAIRPENMKELVLSGQDVVPACNNLIDAAKNIIKYPDNMSAIVIGFSK